MGVPSSSLPAAKCWMRLRALREGCHRAASTPPSAPSAAAIPDLLSGQVQMIFTSFSTAAPHLRPICTAHTCETNEHGCKRGDQGDGDGPGDRDLQSR